MVGETVLVVDDEEEISQLISIYLEEERYKAIVAGTGKKAITLAQTTNPDLIVLDIFLPDIDGLEVCQQIRRFSTAPIIFLSSKSTETDKIVGLMIGGDDYITKPFSPSELMARINAHLRRRRLNQINNFTNDVIRYDDLEIDKKSHVVRLKGKFIQLSTKEFHLLKILAESPNRVFSLDQLFDIVWAEESLGDTRTVSVHISNLRKKIEPDSTNSKYIHTVRGIGYKFVGK